MEEERPGHHDAAVETGPKVGGSGARLRKITFKGRRNLNFPKRGSNKWQDLEFD